MKTLLATFIVLCALAVSTPQALAQFVEGKDYVRATYQTGIAGGKVEVTQIFHYRDIHNLAYERALPAWRQKHATDVIFVRVPFFSGDVTDDVYAPAYFAAAVLGIDDRVQPEASRLIASRQNLLGRSEDWVTFLSAYTDRQAVETAMNSFGVQAMVNRTHRIQETYGIDHPEFLVGGVYRTDDSMGGGYARTLDVLDFLVAKVRSDREAAAPAKPCKRRCK